MSIIDHVLNVLGVLNGGGRWYLWWSGMFGNITIFAAMYMLYRKHNCHIHGCWRIGRHTAVDANGTEHIVCKSHHPDLGKGHRLQPHHLLARVSGSAGSSPPAPR